MIYSVAFILLLSSVNTVEPHYNGTEGTDCIFALLPKSGVASWAISVRKKAEEKLVVIISTLSNSEIANKIIAKNDDN